MKKFISFVALSVLMFSCGKISTPYNDGRYNPSDSMSKYPYQYHHPDSTSQYSTTDSIVANIGGVPYKFTRDINGGSVFFGHPQNTGFYGVSYDSVFNYVQFHFISKGDSIAIKTYGVANDSSYVFFEFKPGNDSHNFKNGSVLNPVTITVTSVTDSTVQGTFQGTIYLDGDSTAASKSITAGIFNLNRYERRHW